MENNPATHLSLKERLCGYIADEQSVENSFVVVVLGAGLLAIINSWIVVLSHNKTPVAMANSFAFGVKVEFVITTPTWQL